MRSWVHLRMVWNLHLLHLLHLLKWELGLPRLIELNRVDRLAQLKARVRLAARLHLFESESRLLTCMCPAPEAELAIDAIEDCCCMSP
jgi:hypothetical protein